MEKIFTPKIKIILCFFIIIFASIVIYIQMNKNILKISELEESKGKTSKIEIVSSPLSNKDIKIYKRMDNEEFTEAKDKENKNGLLKDTKVFELDTQDMAKPNNITNIKTAIVDDYIIIDFDEAIDNGTKYEYYIQENNVKKETSEIFSKSGIKGYSYVIDNNPASNAILDQVNKLDNTPILHTKIEWDKDYYLHIKACDNNNNFSDTLTYKINLPSNGVRMKYLDINSNIELSPEESIVGSVNDEYNLLDCKKQLENYTLVKVEGEEHGRLKKERINIKYLYAKKAGINVKYLNKITGEEIIPQTYIDGYEGKEYDINPKKIKGYEYCISDKVLNGNMTSENCTVNLYYNEIGNVQISYIDELTGEKILPNKIVKGIVGDEYNIEEKEIPGYEISRKIGNSDGIFSSGINEVYYYYKRKARVTINHVDIEDNTILYTEYINGYEGDKKIVNSKNFEGYILNDKFKNSDDNSKDENDKNIIDELLEEEDLEEIEENDYPKEEIKNTIEQYDIVLEGGSDSEYIIYYKKI